jgi:Predicted hydrolase (HAD superfamily)
MNAEIEYVAFDADDTLWVNELFFCEYEKEFCSLIKEYLPGSVVSQKLYDMEMSNISLYGYGVKGMMLGMIELIPKIVDADALPHAISEVIRLGKELLQKPVTLLDGVMRVLTELKGKYKLVLVTKGDLIDQERKIQQSGLTNYFYHVEIMADKQCSNYLKLINRLGCLPEHFLMIGNSLKSDVLPVLQLGGFAAYVPYSTTWKHEQVEQSVAHPHLIQLKEIVDILNCL